MLTGAKLHKVMIKYIKEDIDEFHNGSFRRFINYDTLIIKKNHDRCHVDSGEKNVHRSCLLFYMLLNNVIKNVIC